MAETICIYDDRGNKICYRNHAARRRGRGGRARRPARIHYELWASRIDGARAPRLLGRGTLARGVTCVGKLAVAVAAARRAGWRSWEFISHMH